MHPNYNFSSNIPYFFKTLFALRHSCLPNVSTNEFIFLHIQSKYCLPLPLFLQPLLLRPISTPHNTQYRDMTPEAASGSLESNSGEGGGGGGDMSTRQPVSKLDCLRFKTPDATNTCSTTNVRALSHE
jgi:hypothetical protein